MRIGSKRWAVWVFRLASVALVAAACEGKQRNFGSVSDGEAALDPAAAAPGGPSSDAATPPGPTGSDGDLGGGFGSEGLAPVQRAEPTLVLGDDCMAAGECVSGFCVDGVCCDAPCTDLCATCAAPGSEGTCGPAAGDPSCDALSCGIRTECRGYDDAQLALNCEAFGSCRSDVTCTPLDEPAGTPCRGGLGACDGLGECVVPGTAALGEACGTNADCGSDFCVSRADGNQVCCEAACDGLCQQCSADGRCDEVPAHDADCAPVTCPGDNICRDYPETLTENLCRALGQCRSTQDCAPIALRAASSCACDGAGDCTLVRGARCEEDVQCSEGACEVDPSGARICCTENCGPGLICLADGSRCVECAEGEPVRCEGATAVRCVSGSRQRQACPNGCAEGVGCSDRAPIGFPCSGVECVSGAVCQNDVAGARRCCSRDCAAEGKVCAENGSCICPPGQTAAGNDCLLQRGDPCGTGAAQCGAGLACVDGVCCDDACDGACERCNVPGSVGQCAFDSRDTNGCLAGEQCVARDDCRLGLRERCSGAGDCVSNNCASLRGVGAQICCAQQCGGQRSFCSSDGSRCVECESNAHCQNGCNAQGLCNPPVPPGGACTVDTQCASGSCLTASDNANLRRCCASCGSGQTCDAQGRCVTPPSDLGGPCTGGQSCSAGSTCVAGICCNSACSGICESCNSNGLCQQEFGTNGDCPAGQECRNRTSCQPRSAALGESCANGESCPTGADCASGRCIERCRLSSAGSNNGSVVGACVLAP